MDLTDLTISSLWASLKDVSSVEFIAESKNGDSGWNGSGSGLVKVETPDNKTITYFESGKWTTHTGVEMGFSNKYKWSLLSDTSTISLQHLRYGENTPVNLFHLESNSNQLWKSTSPHICKDDEYSLEISHTNTTIFMRWWIVGLRKDEYIQYRYV